MFLYRLYSEENNIYIEIYNTKNLELDGDFLIKKPERIDWHKITQDEYDSMVKKGLVPESLDFSIDKMEIDHYVLAVDYGNGFIATYINETENGELVGRMPSKRMKLYKVLFELFYIAFVIGLGVLLLKFFNL